jgi:hypothetical protein
MTVRTMSADTSGRSSGRQRQIGRARGRAGAGRQSGERRGDPADLVAELAKPRRVAVRCDVGQAVRRAGPAEGDSEYGRALGLVAVDNQSDFAIGQPRIDRVDQRGRRGDDRPIPALAGLQIHPVEQPVHRCPAVGFELDPQGRRGNLAVDSFGRGLDPYSVGNPQAAGLDGSRGAIERVVAIAGDQDRWRVEAAGAGPRAGQIVVHFG